jgi:hypothetical protein
MLNFVPCQRADKGLAILCLQHREAVMGSYQHPSAFRPIDLEVIDRVYEVAWEVVKAQDLYRDSETDDERRQRLRKMIFIFAKPNNVDFDELCDQVLTNLTEPWAVPPRKRRPPPKVST